MAQKALCVGINHFKNYPSAALQGCVNDANDMAALLKDFMGFSSGDITILTDAQATKVKIMQALTAMVNDAISGKYSKLVFSLSSHGTQVPDTNGDEADKKDEAFCPYDLAQKGDQWDIDHVIVDDELHDLFIQLPDSVVLEVYLDTCHSGTGLKAIDMLIYRKPRYLPPPTAKGFRQLEQMKPRTSRKLLADKAKPNQFLWAGCKANQTSSDAKIGSAYHGAFTYYYVTEVRASANKLLRKDIIKKVAADLKANHYTQVPQLESPATQR